MAFNQAVVGSMKLAGCCDNVVLGDSNHRTVSTTHDEPFDKNLRQHDIFLKMD